MALGFDEMKHSSDGEVGSKAARGAVGVTYVVRPDRDASIEEVWAGRNVPLD